MGEKRSILSLMRLRKIKGCEACDGYAVLSYFSLSYYKKRKQDVREF